MRRDGFTLIELLVVIGIIALLIAVLLPGGHAARPEMLATGTILLDGTPVASADVRFHPMTDVGFGGSTGPWDLSTDCDGMFQAITTSCWRKDNPSTGRFAVTIDLPEDLKGPCPQHQLARYADPRTTPLHVVIEEGRTPNFTFDLAER